MVLARAWRRRLYASLGMTLVVPVALLVCLTVLALNGGVPGLGSLREAFSGPSAPPAAGPVLGGLPASSRTALSATVAPGTATAAVGSLGGLSTASRTGGRGVAGGGGLHQTRGRSGSPGAGGGGGGGYSGSPQPSGGPPSRNPTVVDRVLGSVAPVTSGLPAPVRSVATQTLKSGQSVADRVLHGLPVQ